MNQKTGYMSMGALPFKPEEYEMFAKSQKNGAKYDCKKCFGRGYISFSTSPAGKKSIILCQCLDTRKFLEEGKRRRENEACTPLEVADNLSISPIEKDLGEVVEGEIAEEENERDCHNGMDDEKFQEDNKNV